MLKNWSKHSGLVDALDDSAAGGSNYSQAGGKKGAAGESGDDRAEAKSSSKLYLDPMGDNSAGNKFSDNLISSDFLLDESNAANKPAHLFMYEQSAMRSLSEPVGREPPRMTPSNEDYYPRVAVMALMRILRDSAQSVHHSSVTQAIMQIFNSLGMQCVPFLDQIVPYLLQLIRRSNPGLRESLLQQLSQLASIVQYHLIPYLPALFEIIKDYWIEHLEHILQLVEDVAATSSDAFGSYVTVVLPLLLSSLVVPKDVTAETMKVLSRRKQGGSMLSSKVVSAQVLLKPLEKTLSCHDALRNTLRPHMHLVVPAFCKLLNQLQDIGPESEPWQIMTVHVMRRICSGYRGTIVEQANIITTRVMHTLTRAVIRAHDQGISPTSQLFTECISTLCRVGRQLGSRLAVFDGLILRSIEGRGLNTTAYKDLSTQLHAGVLLEFTYADREDMTGSIPKEESESDLVGIYHSQNFLSSKGAGSFAMSQTKMAINQGQLARSWDVSQRSTAADWNEWLRRLKVDLLRESPSPALRACSALAQAHAALANDLFHAAFVSCWHELNEQYQDSLVRALQAAFRSTTIPSEILQSLLNLAEFMEHDVEALPISLSILAELAQRGHAYAKALHYRELEFQTSPASCFESLININKKLDQYDAAMGVMKVVGALQAKHPELADAYKVQEAWLAKLGHWDQALVRYESRLEENPRDTAAVAGKLKCLDALGRWEEAIRMCNSTLDLLRDESETKKKEAGANRAQADQGETSDTTTGLANADRKSPHTKAAVIGARAAWSLNEWELMDTFVAQLPADNLDACFMKAVLAVHSEDYESSKEWIDVTRHHLDASVSTLLTESYGRAYVPLIMVQQCSELEEITEYKMLLREAGLSTETGTNSKLRSGVSAFGPGNTMMGSLGGRGMDLNAGASNNKGNSPTGHTGPSLLSQGLSLHQMKQQSNTEGGTLAGTGVIRTGIGGQHQPQPVRRTNNIDTASEGGPRPPARPPLASQRRGGDTLHSVEMSPSAMHSPESSQPHAASAPPSRSTHSSPGLHGRDPSAPSSSIQQSLQAEVRRRKSLLAEKWKKRIRGCASSGRAAIPVWKYLLNGRRMVLNEMEDFDTWLEFATLCRHGGNNALAERVLNMSQKLVSQRMESTEGVATAEEVSMGYRIKFALLKQDWVLTNDSTERYTSNSTSRILDKATCVQGLEELLRSLTGTTDSATHLDCLLKLGEWKVNMVEPGKVIDKSTRRDVLALYGRATMIDTTSYRAWHQWGLSNYRAIEESRLIMPTDSNASTPYKRSSRNSHQIVPSQVNIPLEVASPLAVNAAKGLLKAIALGTRRWSSSVTQDMLCVLSVWFRFGRIPDVAAALEAGLNTVHLDNWLGVLPQLIARIDHPDFTARDLLHKLLVRLGVRHSQALVYPLSVALKSPRGARKEAAEGLMQSLRKHSGALIDQALMVSHELVRVAILWQEEWHESLEEASRQYFGEGNILAMLETLTPLHNALISGPNTMRESSFVQAYGHDLNTAWDSISQYKQLMMDQGVNIPVEGAAPGKHGVNRGQNASTSAEDTLLHQAWDLYYSVFKRINAQLPQVTALELQYCSPALMSARDLDLGVPGTYTVSGSTVRIRHFSPTVAIIRSKQRPRKIRIIGEGGLEFVFLLKGHEDLRQDERAMQLFGLVNELMFHDQRTSSESHDLSIQRYAVLPLSPTAGLISWVPNCDTMHDLIRDYREGKRVMLNVEHKLMQQVAPNQTYEQLPYAHKLEVFEYALANTPGEDLAKILWLKSENSEVWLERRATYTRSLAVMSMVGYVLGLGDRHPSNLMLDRKSGKVLHIDFGDCFEVAMQRDKFPEKVPFRLTRMMVNAMEVSGIEGNYRRTCEKVMFVLRENRDSLVATLEAFVHDPLISWRLLNNTAGKKAVKKGPEGRAATQSQSSQGQTTGTTGIGSGSGATGNTVTSGVTSAGNGASNGKGSGAGSGTGTAGAGNSTNSKAEQQQHSGVTGASGTASVITETDATDQDSQKSNNSNACINSQSPEAKTQTPVAGSGPGSGPGVDKAETLLPARLTTADRSDSTNSTNSTNGSNGNTSNTSSKMMPVMSQLPGANKAAPGGLSVNPDIPESPLVASPGAHMASQGLGMGMGQGLGLGLKSVSSNLEALAAGVEPSPVTTAGTNMNMNNMPPLVPEEGEEWDKEKKEKIEKMHKMENEGAGVVLDTESPPSIMPPPITMTSTSTSADTSASATPTQHSSLPPSPNAYSHGSGGSTPSPRLDEKEKQEKQGIKPDCFSGTPSNSKPAGMYM